MSSKVETKSFELGEDFFTDSVEKLKELLADNQLKLSCSNLTDDEKLKSKSQIKEIQELINESEFLARVINVSDEEKRKGNGWS